jgi:hypothetical protein
MGEEGYLGEFEQMLLLAAMRLVDEAWGVAVMQELESRRRSLGFSRLSLRDARPAGGQGMDRIRYFLLPTETRWPATPHHPP